MKGKISQPPQKLCFIYPDPVVARGKRAVLLRSESGGRVGDVLNQGRTKARL